MKNESIIFQVNLFFFIFGLAFHVSAEQEDWRHHPIYYNTKNGAPVPLMHQEENVATNGIIVSYGKAQCHCQGWDCSCCTDIIYDAIKFKRRSCFQFGYSLKLEKIKIRLLMNETIVVDDYVSDDNPPPFCLPAQVPLSSSLEMCAKVFNLSFPGPGRNIQFCLNFETKHASHRFILKFACARFGDNGFQSISPEEPERPVSTRKPIVISVPETAQEEDFALDVEVDRVLNKGNSTRFQVPAKPPNLVQPLNPNFVQPIDKNFVQTSKPAVFVESPTNFIQPAKPAGFVLPPREIDQPMSIVNFVQPTRVITFIQPLPDHYGNESTKGSKLENTVLNSSFVANLTDVNNMKTSTSDKDLTAFDDSFLDLDIFHQKNDTKMNNTKPQDHDLVASFSNALKTLQKAPKPPAESHDFSELDEVFMDGDETKVVVSKPEKFPPIPYSPQFLESFSQSPTTTTTKKPSYIQKIPFKKVSG